MNHGLQVWIWLVPQELQSLNTISPWKLNDLASLVMTYWDDVIQLERGGVLFSLIFENSSSSMRGSQGQMWFASVIMSCALLYTIEKFQKKNSTKVAYSIPATCLGFFLKFKKFSQPKWEIFGNQVISYAFVSNLVLKASLQTHFIHKVYFAHQA